MKIFDCFMFYDEDLLLDLRLNILDQHVDFFVIVESKYFHNGKERQLKFDIKKYHFYKKLIIKRYKKIQKTDKNHSFWAASKASK